jgi:hypothetical protein
VWITIRVTPKERACVEKLARQRNITITQLLLSGVANKMNRPDDPTPDYRPAKFVVQLSSRRANIYRQGRTLFERLETTSVELWRADDDPPIELVRLAETCRAAVYGVAKET